MSTYKLHLQHTGRGVTVLKNNRHTLFEKLDAADCFLSGGILLLLFVFAFSVLRLQRNLHSMQRQFVKTSSLSQRAEATESAPPLLTTRTISQNLPPAYGANSTVPWDKKPPYINEWDIHKNNDAYETLSKKENAAKNTSLGILRGVRL